nr:hypothetical protein CFP56_02556 [Quercus suber]
MARYLLAATRQFLAYRSSNSLSCSCSEWPSTLRGVLKSRLGNHPSSSSLAGRPRAHPQIWLGRKVLISQLSAPVMRNLTLCIHGPKRRLLRMFAPPTHFRCVNIITNCRSTRLARQRGNTRTPLFQSLLMSGKSIACHHSHRFSAFKGQHADRSLDAWSTLTVELDLTHGKFVTMWRFDTPNVYCTEGGMGGRSTRDRNLALLYTQLRRELIEHSAPSTLCSRTRAELCRKQQFQAWTHGSKSGRIIILSHSVSQWRTRLRMTVTTKLEEGLA